MTSKVIWHKIGWGTRMRLYPALVLMLAALSAAGQRLPDLRPRWPDSTIRFTQVDLKYSDNFFSHYVNAPVYIPSGGNNPAYYLFPQKELMHEHFFEMNLAWNFRSRPTDNIRFSFDMMLGTTLRRLDSAKPYNDMNFGMGVMLSVDKKWFGLGCGGWLGRFNIPDTSMTDLTSYSMQSGYYAYTDEFSVKSEGYRELIPRVYLRLFPVKYLYFEVRSGFTFTPAIDHEQAYVFGLGSGLGRNNGTHVYWAFSDLGGMVEAQWVMNDRFGINGQYYYNTGESRHTRFQAGILFRFGEKRVN